MQFGRGAMQFEHFRKMEFLADEFIKPINYRLFERPSGGTIEEPYSHPLKYFDHPMPGTIRSCFSTVCQTASPYQLKKKTMQFGRGDAVW